MSRFGSRIFLGVMLSLCSLTVFGQILDGAKELSGQIKTTAEILEGELAERPSESRLKEILAYESRLIYNGADAIGLLDEAPASDSLLCRPLATHLDLVKKYAAIGQSGRVLAKLSEGPDAKGLSLLYMAVTADYQAIGKTRKKEEEKGKAGESDDKTCKKESKAQSKLEECGCDHEAAMAIVTTGAVGGQEGILSELDVLSEAYKQLKDVVDKGVTALATAIDRKRREKALRQFLKDSENEFPSAIDSLIPTYEKRLKESRNLSAAKFIAHRRIYLNKWEHAIKNGEVLSFDTATKERNELIDAARSYDEALMSKEIMIGSLRMMKSRYAKLVEAAKNNKVSLKSLISDLKEVQEILDALKTAKNELKEFSVETAADTTS